MAVSALLKTNPHPTDDELAEAITNICRCGTYPRIRNAVRALARRRSDAMATTRRMILLGGLGAAGALVVGYAPVAEPPASNGPTRWPPSPANASSTTGSRSRSDDTVTVVIPHCDMGTGIYTALPQMAAEELDADWSKVKVEAAPPDSIFANGPLGEGFILSSQNMTADSIPGLPARHGRQHLPHRSRASWTCRSPAARPPCAPPASTACASPAPPRARCWSRPPPRAGTSIRRSARRRRTRSSTPPRAAASAMASWSPTPRPTRRRPVRR